MKYFSPLLFWILLSTGLPSADNILNKAVVSGSELRLIFSSWFDARNVKQMILKNPPRVVLDIKNSRLASSNIASGLLAKGVRSFRISQYSANTIRLVVETSTPYDFRHYQPMSSRSFYHISLPKNSTSIANVLADDKSEPYEEKPKKIRERTTNKNPLVYKESEDVVQLEEEDDDKGISSFFSFFSPKKKGPRKDYTIVVDAGHGGKDSGAVGAGRYYEKVVVLQIAKQLQKELRSKGFTVKMSRSSDNFIELKNRTKFANRHNADIFVSIHANATPNKSRHNIAEGIETYFLQKTRSERDKQVAALENSVVLDQSDYLSKSVILDSILSGPKIVESNKLAIDVQKNMLKYAQKGYRNVKNGGVRPAPFWVLIGAQMPSILVEVGYITNPTERSKIFTPSYQKYLAKGIADGVSNYLVNHEKIIE